MIKKVCVESRKEGQVKRLGLLAKLSSAPSCPQGTHVPLGKVRGGVSSRTYFIQGSVVDPRPLPRTWWALGCSV